MKRASHLLFAILLVTSFVVAQQGPTVGRTLVVIPFENTSPTPGLEWLSESFPATFRSQLDSPVLYVVTREERFRAYDRQGVPSTLHPSRATIYRLAEQMDVDYAVLGSYSYDGAHLTATAQLLNMRGEKLLPAVTESAPLNDLGILQSALAWDIVRLIRPNFGVPKDHYIAGIPPMRLDALENYTRGIMATAAEEKIQRFREAARINPSFSEAWLELGKAYYAERQYEQAVVALEKIPEQAKVAREANFYLGLSSYAHGDFDKAQHAFEFVATRLPLAEVYNDLGVVAARRGQKRAADSFERAIQNDPSNPDYHFNLALALARNGDKARAARELRTSLEQKPGDAEAKSLLDSLTSPTNTTKLPAERLNRNYEENAFRQMTTQLQSWAEERFARSDAHTHARYHIELGKELLAHGFTTEAEAEFRHAATVDPSSPAPLAALAEVYDARGDSAQARAEAEASLRVHESVDAYLILARLDFREDHTDAAAKTVDRVLQLDPRNAVAQDLKRTLAAKLAEKAQPLPQE